MSQLFARTHCLLLFFLLPLNNVFGCSCSEPSPCESYGNSQLIFLGTVTDISKGVDGSKTIRMTVDLVYKGELEKTIQLFDDGVCSAPSFQVGTQYLIYTSGSTKELLPVRGCTRSRDVRYAEEDLVYLKQVAEGKADTLVSGKVLLLADEIDGVRQDPSPLKDVRVSLSGEADPIYAVTNSLGLFAFENLLAGKYLVEGRLSGYQPWITDVTLSQHGCVLAEVLMHVDRRIEGYVRNKDGTPASGAQVEAVSTKKQQSGDYIHKMTSTDENGHYLLDGMLPGDYYLGINLRTILDEDHPFPRIYYPGTADVREAISVNIVIGATVQKIDLQIPHKLNLITMHGRILNADGKSPLPKDKPHIRITQPGIEDFITIWVEIDTDGRFQFELCEGIPYSGIVISGYPDHTHRSAPAEFTPSKENNQLAFILDRTIEPYKD